MPDRYTIPADSIGSKKDGFAWPFKECASLEQYLRMK